MASERATERAGPYELLAAIESGGMGTVYRARRGAGEPVALKLLNRPADARARARFERERRLQADLGEEQGFVPLLDADLAAEKPYIVMPLLEGGTLRKKLAAGPLAIDETVALGRALATALGRAHARGIVHRDLKPENVLFTRKGRALISDLGLAKRFSGSEDAVTESPEISKTGSMQGTVRYMAPEQAENSKLAGPQADVFSLGAILYECLTGAPAFPGDTVVEVLRAVMRGSPAPLESLRKDVPAPLAAIVARALDKDPARRFKDGAALAAALGGEELVPSPGRLPAGALALVAAVALLALGGALLAPVVRARLRAREAAALSAKGTREALDRALELEPLLVEAWVRRAELRLASGELDGALSDASSALAIDPRHARAFLVRAEVHLLRQDWTHAVDDATAAAALDATLARAFAIRARARIEFGQLDAAIADATRAIDLDPAPVLPWMARALARLAKGDSAGALADANRAIEADPAAPTLRRYRGRIKVLVSDDDGAIADFTKAIELDPRDGEAWTMRGTARCRKGDPEGAVADLDRGLALAPGDAAAWATRARARLALTDATSAVEDATRAIELDEKLVPAWLVRGDARRAKGDLAGAATDYERVLALDPARGDADELRQQIRRARKKGEDEREKDKKEHEREREREKDKKEHEREREKKSREREKDDD